MEGDWDAAVGAPSVASWRRRGGRGREFSNRASPMSTLWAEVQYFHKELYEVKVKPMRAIIFGSSNSSPSVKPVVSFFPASLTETWIHFILDSWAIILEKSLKKPGQIEHAASVP